MTERHALDDRRRGLEEEYFRKKEQELIDKMRRHHEEEVERRRLGEKAGVANEEILNDLRALGYTPETVMLLYLMPLIETAWAEGHVSPRERELIVKAARSRGIEAGSSADRQLNDWLTERPSKELFEKTLRAIGAILQARPPEEREASQRDLLSLCAAVASASGGIVGLRAVSEEERQMLAHITEELKTPRSR